MKHFPQPQRRLAAVFLAAVAVGHLSAQSTVSWNFGTAAPGTATPSSPPVSNLAVSAVSQGNNNGTTTLISTTSASSGYTGASGTYNAGAAARTGVLNTDAGGSTYFEFTLTPQNGASVSLTDISFGSRSTGTGPQAYTIRTDADSYAADITNGMGTFSNNSTWALKTNTSLGLTSFSSPRTVRIYGYNGAGSPAANTANWRIDDLTLTVTVTGGTTDTLTLSLSPATIIESGPSNTSTATVTRSGTPPFAGDVTVDIAVSDPSVATAPATVVLPAATGSANFSVTAVDDSFADGDQTATVTVSSAGFISDVETITVQNDGDTPTVLINEICAYAAADHNGDGVTNQSDDEFVELVNKSGANLDISGWTLSDNSQVRHTFASGTILLPNQAVVVFAGGTVPTVIGNAPAFRSTAGQLGLNNTGGDTVTVRDASSIFITSATYSGDVSSQAASFNLSPEVTFGSPYVLHTAVSGAVGDVSPGRKVDGTEFITLDPLTLTLSPTSILENGGTSTGTVTRPGSTTGALTVSLLSSDTTEATVPPTVEIPDGQASAEFTITGVDDIEPDGPINVTISASALGFGVGQAVLEVTSDTDAVPPATLAPGSIAFTGFNADGADDFAFVALTAIPEGSQIRFTDNEWNGQPIGAGGIFNTGEGFVLWTAPTGGVAAGTVVIIGSTSDSLTITSTTDGSTPIGTVSGTLNLNASDETLYAYQGTELRASGFLSVIATHTADQVAETGLTVSHLIYLPADVDVAAYTGSRSSQAAFSGYLALIADTSATNWTTQDGATDNSYDNIVPDIPFDGTAFTLASSTGYATWASTNAGGETADLDYDKDGVPNGVEFFMNAAAGFTVNPGLVGGTVTWPNGGNLLPADYGTKFKVQTSTNLSAWTDVLVDDPQLSNLAGSLSYTPTTPAPFFVRLLVTP